jgi:amidohydrolase
MDIMKIINISDEAIKNASETITGVGRRLWENPETGYRETVSAALLTDELEKLGFTVRKNLALTGFRADLDTGKPGPVIAIVGEYDALLIPSHPEAVNGAVHSCGHNTSAANLIGAAIGLKAAAASGELCGKIAFIGSPAEECVELDYRQELINAGKIRSIAGKSQLIREGVFDDVDIAFMHHLNYKFGFNDHNGSVCKKIIFHGKSCHAARPEQGRNALNAMNLALHALGLLRESYSSSDMLRFHGIVSDGGRSVNILPDRVVMDYMLRAETVEKLLELNDRFDHVVTHAGMAAECETEIQTMHYSMPLYDDLDLGRELECVVKEMLPEAEFDFNGKFFPSCTDMGDVSLVIPSIHGYIPGMTGTAHGNDFGISNYYDACVIPAMINARLAIRLLADNGAIALPIAEKKKKMMPISEYIQIIDRISGF